MDKIPRLILVFTLFFSSITFAQQTPFRAVQDFFLAMSNVDHGQMKALVTGDFQLLEMGEDWDLDDLIAVVQPSDYARRNYFHLLKSHTNGDMAWVSYWNKATFTKGEKTEAVVWLESAVMVLENQQWKIQMLHSTMIKPEDLPKDISMTEFSASQ